MASLGLLIGGAAINALAFSGTNFLFSRLSDHGAVERERHDLAIEKLQRARDLWNKKRIEKLDYINSEIRKRNESMQYFNDLDKGILEYYRVTGQKLAALPPQPTLTDFYHPSPQQKTGELLFTIGGTVLLSYIIFKYV